MPLRGCLELVCVVESSDPGFLNFLFLYFSSGAHCQGPTSVGPPLATGGPRAAALRRRSGYTVPGHSRGALPISPRAARRTYTALHIVFDEPILECCLVVYTALVQ